MMPDFTKNPYDHIGFGRYEWRGPATKGRVVLYRGDKRSLLQPSVPRGTAGLDAGEDSAFVVAVARRNWRVADGIIAAHVTGAWPDSPFISASPFEGIARRFAARRDEAVFMLSVAIGRIIVPPGMNRSQPVEVLLLGGLDGSEIIQEVPPGF